MDWSPTGSTKDLVEFITVLPVPLGLNFIGRSDLLVNVLLKIPTWLSKITAPVPAAFNFKSKFGAVTWILLLINLTLGTLMYEGRCAVILLLANVPVTNKLLVPAYPNFVVWLMLPTALSYFSLMTTGT